MDGNSWQCLKNISLQGEQLGRIVNKMGCIVIKMSSKSVDLSSKHIVMVLTRAFQSGSY